MGLLLFFVAYQSPQNEQIIDNTGLQAKMPETKYYEYYEELKSPASTVVIYPILTQSAYEWGGIHDFRKGICDECVTAQIYNFYEKQFASSGNALAVLEFLGYPILDDIDVARDPGILEQYDKVILLHNEFVTNDEFIAITSHPNVVYLYPNALNSFVELNSSYDQMTLIRGPGYPTSDVTNGFDWINDNTQFFKDVQCATWEFYPVNNGFMLNCYPEQMILEDGYSLLKEIREL